MEANMNKSLKIIVLPLLIFISVIIYFYYCVEYNTEKKNLKKEQSNIFRKNMTKVW